MPPRHVLVAFLAFAACGGAPPAAASDASALALAFVHVDVIPMDRERVLGDHTVVVRGGRIVAVGPAASTPVPAGARTIDGRKKTLIPGLVDAHVHLWHSGHALLLLANGVTSVRNMWGEELHLALRERIARGELPGPRVFTTTPIVDGEPPIWPTSRVVVDAEGARRIVAEARELGYESGVKVYGRLSAPAYQAIVEAARAASLPVVGHVPEQVGLAAALAARQHTIEHLTGWVPALLRDGAAPAPPGPHRLRQTLPKVDETKIARWVQATVAAGTWNVPTLVVKRDAFDRPERLRELWQRPEMRYVSRVERAHWDPSKDFRSRDLDDEDYAAMHRMVALDRRIVAALAAAGAGLAAGTDMPNPNVIAGFALHEELGLLVEAGLSPYQALRAATAAPAEMLGVAAEQGTIAAGKRADLVLLEGNPLADLGATRRRAGVMAAGRWYPAAELQARLDALAESYAHPPPRFAGMPPVAGAVGYDVETNGVGTTSARIVWRDGRLVGQEAQDPPFSTRTSFESDAARASRVEDGPIGRRAIELAGGRVDVDAYGRRRRLTAPDAAAGGAIPVPPESDVAAMAIVARRAAGLARVGDRLELTLVAPHPLRAEDTIRVKVERIADEAGRRALRVELAPAAEPPQRGTLVVAADGLPERFELEGFEGTVKAARTR